MSQACVIASRVAAAALFALAGCHAVGPDYHPPSTTMPDQYIETAPQSRVMGPPSPSQRRPTDLATWWTAFNDSTLNSLIDRAVRVNLDLK
ncbi:MAG: RND transporter, partial [Phycisphaerae bacterium]|nr:RND transporter [Phycisphaerae bacterium]